MTITESAQSLQEILSDLDSEVRVRWELLRKNHNPPHIGVNFEAAVEAMENRHEKHT